MSRYKQTIWAILGLRVKGKGEVGADWVASHPAKLKKIKIEKDCDFHGRNNENCLDKYLIVISTFGASLNFGETVFILIPPPLPGRVMYSPLNKNSTTKQCKI